MTDENDSLRLDESDSFERAIVRGVVSSSRAVLDGMAGAPRVREDDAQLQKQRTDRRALIEALDENRLSGVEEMILLLRYLPEQFISSWLKLIDAAVGEKNLGSGRGYDTSDKGLGARSGVQMKSEGKDHRGGAGRTGKSASPMPIKSEDALYDVSRYQKRLRSMAREMNALLAERGETREVLRRRCSGKCRRLGEREWSYCPNCSGPMIDEIPKKK
jgi:hypothetical protein